MARRTPADPSAIPMAGRVYRRLVRAYQEVVLYWEEAVQADGLPPGRVLLDGKGWWLGAADIHSVREWLKAHGESERPPRRRPTEEGGA